MKIIDLTQMLDEHTPHWNCDCGFKLTSTFDEVSCVQFIDAPAGIGTHMDAPYHFFSDNISIDQINVENFLGPACVIDVHHKAHDEYLISKQDILDFENKHGMIEPNTIILAFTGWDKHWGEPDKYRAEKSEQQRAFPGFSTESIDYLLTKDIKGIGIDTLSPDGSNIGFPVHKKVLSRGIYILENLCNLDKLPAKVQELISLPLKIKNGAEAPCRVIAKIK
ncbi:cyclase [Paraphotobacterium marinum]|uniref:Cyclase n=2 Tax=Paraphotobacterium marinum TaxID=1755811 RepID=A0A220VFP5_9GAMM|nr:cyclase [Paraphotobacterium marinum]